MRSSGPLALGVSMILAGLGPAVAVAGDGDGDGDAAGDAAEPPPDPTATATLDPSAPAPAAASSRTRRTGHARQFGLGARVGIGLRGIATYDDEDYCGERSTDTATGNAAVCLGRAPFTLSLEASYGVAHNFEVLAEFGIGLERDFGAADGVDGPRVHFVAPGVRIFFSEAKTSKLFTQIQATIDFTSYEDGLGQGRGTDYGFRNLNGLWFDLHRSYGFYVYVGETLTFQRWILGQLEAGFGFQGRYP
jgi:hypothetical protein